MKVPNRMLRAAVASALVFAAASAQAGTLTTATRTFAAENFGLTSGAALGITPGAVTYTYGTPGGIVINPGGVLNMYFRLDNGARLTAAPAGAVITGSAGTGGGLGFSVGAPTLSTDSTTFLVPLSNTTAANITVGVGATLIWTPAALTVNNVNTVLNTAGNVIGIQSSASVLAGAVNSVALPADIDNGLSNTVNVATSVEAITGTVTASSAFPISGAGVAETQRIDVGAPAGALTRFTAPGATSNANSTTLVNLGAVRFTNTASIQFQPDGVTEYLISNRVTASTFSGIVTGLFKTGSGVALFTDTACAAGAVAGGAGVLNVGLTTATFAGAAVPGFTVANGAGESFFICYTVPATAGAIPSTIPTATFNLGTKVVATDALDAATGTLYNLQTNGVTVDVRTYVPAATVGFTSFIRMINTGQVAAAVTIQVIDPVTGVAGPTSTLIASLAAGGATTLTSTQIEAVTGPIAAALRPRLRISAVTNGLQVQSFLLNPGGDFNDVTGAQ